MTHDYTVTTDESGWHTVTCKVDGRKLEVYGWDLDAAIKVAVDRMKGEG